MNIENKLIGAERAGLERSLTLAIRRAAQRGDEDGLLQLANNVSAIATEAGKSQDSEAKESIRRLLAELRAAATGSVPRTASRVLEYKDCAVALSATASRQAKSRKARQVHGYASTFGGEPDSYGDIIQKGAFAKSLARHRAAGTTPKLFWSHDPAQLVGKWLELREDSQGLLADGLLANTTQGRDLDELIAFEALDALSIGFMIPTGGATFDRNGIRIITEIDLHEVSLVSLPANGNARLFSHEGAIREALLDDMGQALARMRELARTLSDDPDSNVLPFPRKAEGDVIAGLQKLSRSIRSATR